MPAKRLLSLLCATCAIGALASAIPAAASAKPTITMSGSTSIFPLASDLARGYLASHGHSVTFRILQGGSDVGIADVAHGRVTIGDSSRDPKPTDPGGLVFKRIARDAVCVATNRSNPLPNLSQAQIQSIFTGRVRNWSDIPGSKMSGSIDLKVRTAASGTQDAFQNIFLGQNLRVAGSASTYASNGLLQQAVKSDPKAIGYVSFDFAAGLHTVPYAGVSCTLRNAKSGQYGGTRNFWMVTRGKARGVAAKFLKWATGRGPQRSIVSKHWVPIR